MCILTVNLEVQLKCYINTCPIEWQWILERELILKDLGKCDLPTGYRHLPKSLIPHLVDQTDHHLSFF